MTNQNITIQKQIKIYQNFAKELSTILKTELTDYNEISLQDGLKFQNFMKITKAFFTRTTKQFF
jgi:hypothetical protein